jgi:Protein of unknown function (DUF1552)
MFITKKSLSRRTFLRGAGVTIALPFLESMIPAQTPLRTAASPKTRFGAIYIPHGSVIDKWKPKTAGSSFEMTETLKPLEPFRNQMTIVSNLAHPSAYGGDGSAGAHHARSSAVYLSGVHPESGPQASLGITADQVMARRLGQDTPLPSLELCIEPAGLNCGAGLTCAYRNTIAWQSPTSPLPMENNPQVVFERLFGDGSSDEQRRARRQQSRSLLDSVLKQVGGLEKDLPPVDRDRLDQYMTDIREIERRIQRAGASITSDLKVPGMPAGIPDNFEDHIKLMFDLQVLAYQAEITRISTMMYARDTSGATYPGSGVRDGFHTASHHSNARARMDSFALINRYHVQMLGYFLEKLRTTPDGDGNLLDHSVVLYGSSMSNGNQHDHDPLPVILAGGAAGQLEGGRHMQYAPHTPMSNLLVSMLNKLGIDAAAHGDSTGRLEI